LTFDCYDSDALRHRVEDELKTDCTRESTRTWTFDSTDEFSLKFGEFSLKWQIQKDFCSLIYDSFTRRDIICVQILRRIAVAVPQRDADL